MWRRKGVWRLAILGLGAAAIGLAVACGGGISRSDYDAVKKQLTAAQEKAAALQKQVSEQQARPAGEAGVTTLMGAKQVPTPTPPPPPTPTPPGQTPAPARTPPPYVSQAVPFAFYVEVLATTTASKYGIASTIACTPSSVFKRGQKMVWRYEVFDMSTGKRLTEDVATTKVRLPNGDESTGRFSQRAGGRVPDAPWMWSANWDVPPDYPLGAVDYTITVTMKDGRSYTWKEPALVREDSDSRPKVVQ